MAHFLQKSKFIYCVCTLCPIENQTNVLNSTKCAGSSKF